MAGQVFEVLSVAMTSSPEIVRIKKFSVIFGVFGPTESNYDVRFARQVSSLYQEVSLVALFNLNSSKIKEN